MTLFILYIYSSVYHLLLVVSMWRKRCDQSITPSPAPLHRLHPSYIHARLHCTPRSHFFLFFQFTFPQHSLPHCWVIYRSVSLSSLVLIYYTQRTSTTFRLLMIDMKIWILYFKHYLWYKKSWQDISMMHFSGNTYWNTWYIPNARHIYSSTNEWHKIASKCQP